MDDYYVREGCDYVTLVRKANSQPWGFRMMGGQDQGTCLHIASVKAGSLAARQGLRAGDAVMRIGQVPASYLSHDHAKAEILRAGNDLHLVVKRGAVPVPAEQRAGRSVVVEEGTKYRGNHNSSLQSRSFRIITDSLVEDMTSLPGGQDGACISRTAHFGLK